MKTKNLFLLAAIAAATATLMTSCNKDDDDYNYDNAGIRFTSGITAPQTKVTTNVGTGVSTWEVGDPIGIYMVETGTTTISEGATNIPYEAKDALPTTSFIPTGGAIYYPVDELKSVDFIAYHPYTGAVANYVYPVELTAQTPQSALDLMYATANNAGAGYSKADRDKTVTFAFEHKLVKLILNVVKGAGVTGDITSVSIKGMNTTANYDLKGAGGLTDIDNIAGITPHTATANSRYEAILLPLAALDATHSVDFTIGTDTYTWATMAADMPKLEAGNIYTYTITLTKYAVKAEGSITNWITAGNTGNGIAD